jgi:hypothetical protein
MRGQYCTTIHDRNSSTSTRGKTRHGKASEEPHLTLITPDIAYYQNS